jgi:hypothetical protein
MSFIKVTAYQCNQQGHTVSQNIPQEIFLNTDLIGEFSGNEVLLKGGEVLTLGANYYTKLRLAPGQTVPIVK